MGIIKRRIKILAYFRIAIYGDFSKYNSKPLKDFVYESSSGRDVFFAKLLKKPLKSWWAYKFKV